jgi:hypothetical protein
MQRHGNVHPSVANRLGAAPALTSALNSTGGGGARTSGAGLNASAQVSIDEAEARARAREILNDFVQQKVRASDLETQLQRSLQEKERISHVMHERRAEAALDKDRLNRELDDARRVNTEAEARVQASRDEVRKVAQACAQRAADTSAHLRLKEQETQQLEAELLKSRDECRQLRAEVARLQSSGTSTDDMEKTQHRMVELAKKLLESEKAKGQLEQGLKDDRRHQQQALRTIESMRKQLVESEQRIKDSESAVTAEREAHERAIAALHREMDSQREMYRQFVERISLMGNGSVSAQALDAAKSTHDTQVRLMQVQLESSKEIALKLAGQLERANDESDRLRAAVAEAKTRHVEDVTDLQKQLHAAEHALLAERHVAQERKQAMQKDQEAVEKLKAVHENLKRDYSEVASRLAATNASLDAALAQHAEIESMMTRLRDEADAREAVERHVADILESRRGLENKMRDQQMAHDHEMQMVKMQLASVLTSGGGGGGGAGMALLSGFSSVPARELERENAALKTRLQEFELERDRMEADRRALARDADDEKRSLRAEIDDLRRQLETARIAGMELRTQATAAQREKEEWASAFAYSERTRAKLQGHIDELEADRHDYARERTGSDTRVTLMQSQLQRLEQQADRDAQEIFRLRRQVANLEVDVAKRDSEIKRLEIGRLEAGVGLHSASAAHGGGGGGGGPSDIALHLHRAQLEERIRSLERKQDAVRVIDEPTPVTYNQRASPSQSPVVPAAERTPPAADVSPAASGGRSPLPVPHGAPVASSPGILAELATVLYGSRHATPVPLPS